MLAATARLASSAIRATCSPGRTPRHVSTAFRAPGINSVCGEANFIQLILLELRGFSSGGNCGVFFFQLSVRPVESLPRGTSVARALYVTDSFRLVGRRASSGDAKRGHLAPPLVTLARPVAL